MVTKRRSSPSEASASYDSAGATIAHLRLQRRADAARTAAAPRAPSARPRARRGSSPIWRSARARRAGRAGCLATACVKIVASSGYSSRHASSAVNERIGAMQLQQRVADRGQRGLRGAARAAVARRRVQAVLQHVEVEAAQVLRAEVGEPLHGEVELVAIVVALHRARDDLRLARARSGRSRRAR